MIVPSEISRSEISRSSIFQGCYRKFHAEEMWLDVFSEVQIKNVLFASKMAVLLKVGSHKPCIISAPHIICSGKEFVVLKSNLNGFMSADQDKHPNNFLMGLKIDFSIQQEYTRIFHKSRSLFSNNTLAFVHASLSPLPLSYTKVKIMPLLLTFKTSIGTWNEGWVVMRDQVFV